MGLTEPSPFTPERILAATDNVDLAKLAKHALAAVQDAGIDPLRQPIDWAFAFHSGRSTADEYGLRKDTLEPDPDGTSIMEVVGTVLLLLAAVTDPDGGAPAIFFGDDVRESVLGQTRINLANVKNWITANHPLPQGGCNVAAAMERLLQIIGDERKIPDITTLHELPDTTEPPVISMAPYVGAIIVEGDPDDPYHVQELARITSALPMLWLVVYVSNQPAYCEVYQDIIGDAANVRFVQLPEGLADMETEDALALFALFAKAVGGWYHQQVKDGHIPVAGPVPVEA